MKQEFILILLASLRLGLEEIRGISKETIGYEIPKISSVPGKSETGNMVGTDT